MPEEAVQASAATMILIMKTIAYQAEVVMLPAVHTVMEMVIVRVKQTIAYLLTLYLAHQAKVILTDPIIIRKLEG
jgi:hypothetical protein